MTYHQPDFFSQYGGDETAFVIERRSTNVAEADEAEQRNSKPSQKQEILEWFQAHPGEAITHLDAQRLFGCARLAARVRELRKEEWDIQSRSIEMRGGKRVAEYWMEGQP